MIPSATCQPLPGEATANDGEPGATEREQSTQVSPDFFATLGVGPAMGRTFTEQETTYRTDNVRYSE